MDEAIVAVRVVISGKVQGVGYRHWTERRASAQELSGFVRNLSDGTVEAVFSGPVQEVEDMIARCKVGPRAAKVETVAAEPWTGDIPKGFKVLATA